jgi:carbamoyltransferase
MIILGIHDGHNASACLLMDGRVAGAVQEERFSRIKNDDCFPFRSVTCLLREAGLTPANVDYVAMNGRHMPLPRGREGLLKQFNASGSTRSRIRRALRRTPLNRIFRKERQESRLANTREAGFDAGRIVFVEHHTAHAAAAYWGSPWRREPVLVLTCDAAGDDLSGTVSVWQDGKARRLAAVEESHSFGMIYALVTFLMGMVPNEHEYKIMGLAPYARKEDAERVGAKFGALLSLSANGDLGWTRARGVPDLFLAGRHLERVLRLERFDAVAAGLQKFTEEFLAEWADRCVRRTGIGKVALGGGVFMNVKANQAIAALPGVSDLFIFPSCGDESNAFGAAYAQYASLRAANQPPIEPLGPLYLGPESKPGDVEAALRRQGGFFRVSRPGNMAQAIAALLAAGEIVARYRGRTEFGARALGNRSILADPESLATVKTINEMIKSRDFWMPFAVSINKEYEQEYIVNPKRLAAPYMMITFATTGAVGTIRAGTHPYDGTVRPQIVYKDWNPEYHALIEAFRSKTGKGAVLNTSFNLHGHPIVNTAAEALDVFARSGLRHLALEDYLVSKS